MPWNSRTARLLAFAGALLCIAPDNGGVAAAESKRGTGGVPQPTGLPIPRFVSLRSSEVNVRSGPSVNYPIEWVFQRKDMPVEVTAEFDTWRRIRDWQGTEGWVHQTMLSSKRGVVVTGQARLLRAEPDAAAPAVAQANIGVMGALLRCAGPWCQVDLKGYRGWLRRDEMWGVKENETLP